MYTVQSVEIVSNCRCVISVHQQLYRDSHSHNSIRRHGNRRGSGTALEVAAPWRRGGRARQKQWRGSDGAAPHFSFPSATVTRLTRARRRQTDRQTQAKRGAAWAREGAEGGAGRSMAQEQTDKHSIDKEKRGEKWRGAFKSLYQNQTRVPCGVHMNRSTRNRKFSI